MGAAAISAAHAQDGVAMRPNHDGIYAVNIVTQQGSCNKDYHWMISVSGGRVSSAGDTPMEASGQINQRGTVALGVSALRPGRHGYRKARDGVWLGHLVVNDDAMRRFVAGHKARLIPANPLGYCREFCHAGQTTIADNAGVRKVA